METPMSPWPVTSDTSSWTRSAGETLERALVACLGQPVVTPTDADIRKRPGRVTAVGWLYFAFWLAFALACLYLAWRGFGTYDWWWFWGISGILFLVGALGFGNALYLVWRGRHPAVDAPGAPQLSVRALRGAVLAGDDAVAPALCLPAEAPTPAIQAGSALPTLQVFPPQRRFLFDTIFFPAFSTVTVSFLIVIQLAFSGKNSFAWQALILLPLALVLNLFDLIALFQRSRSVGVDVSDEELRWPQGSRQQALPWNEVRGWCVVFLPSGGLRSFFTWLSWPNSIRTQPTDAVYALIGDHTSLTWLYHARSTRTAQGSQILAHAIQSRISMPLRDLTPALPASSISSNSAMVARGTRRWQ